MNKQTESVRAALRDALQTGKWEWFGEPNAVRRMVVRDTPEGIPTSGWPELTYTEAEFVSFTVVDGVVRRAVYGHSFTPWTGRRDMGVSVKRALEILGSADAEAADRIVHPKKYL